MLLCLAGCASAPPNVPAPVAPVEQVHRDPTVTAQAPRPTAGSRAARVALQQVGEPYRYGGSGPGGFDCSGLIHYAYRQIGLQTPRTTGQLWQKTQAVNASSLQVGDVLFFDIDGKPSHVGLYLGDGEFVHAPRSGKRVSVETLNADFYRDAFIRGGRIAAAR